MHTFMSFSDLLITIVLNVDKWARFVLEHFSIHSKTWKNNEAPIVRPAPSAKLSSLLLIGN